MVEADMLEPILNLPENALGFSAHGIVTGPDYENVLIPAVEEKLSRFPKIHFLYHLSEDFPAVAPLPYGMMRKSA